MLARLVILFSTLLVLLVAGVVVYQDYNAYQADITESKLEAKQLTKIITDHVSLSFLAADLTLRRALERHRFHQLFGNNLKRDLDHHFRMWINEAPHMVTLLYANEYGMIELASQKEGYFVQGFDVGLSLKHQHFFQTLQTEETTDQIIDHITINASQYIILGRRVHKLNGNFGGVVLSLLDSKYISQFFHSIVSKDHTNMTLMLNQKPLLTVDSIDPQAFSHMNNFLQRQNGFTFDAPISTTITKSANNPFYVFAFQQLPHMPLMVALVVNESDIFLTWQANRLNYIIFLVIVSIFALVIVLFIVTLARQMKSVQESEKTAVLASQAKSEFLAKMSHELRTPLNAIIGFSEMLDSGYFGPINERQKERIRDINLCGSHLLELINDILEFSKGEAGKLSLQEATVNLENIVEKSIRIVHQRAKNKGVSITEDCQQNLPLIHVDERKIRQVIINLLANAIKFTNKGGTVKICTEIDRNSQEIFISIIDNGIGIAPENVAKAFSVFGQIQQISEPQEGTGLGLPLCKMLVELHEGELKLESVPGIGTKVTIILPAERIAQLSTAPHSPNMPYNPKNTNVVHQIF